MLFSSSVGRGSCSSLTNVVPRQVFCSIKQMLKTFTLSPAQQKIRVQVKKMFLREENNAFKSNEIISSAKKKKNKSTVDVSTKKLYV